MLLALLLTYARANSNYRNGVYPSEYWNGNGYGNGYEYVYYDDYYFW